MSPGSGNRAIANRQSGISESSPFAVFLKKGQDAAIQVRAAGNRLRPGVCPSGLLTVTRSARGSRAEPFDSIFRGRVDGDRWFSVPAS